MNRDSQINREKVQSDCLFFVFDLKKSALMTAWFILSINTLFDLRANPYLSASDEPMKKKHFVGAGLMMLLLSSCVITRPPAPSTVASYAPLQQHDCIVPPDQIHLFFEGEASDFSYQKLGVLEIRGSRDARLEDLLDHLRYAAWEHCANGIIHIQKEYRTIEGDLDIDNESIDIRSEVIYSGIAVDIRKNPQFYEKYGRQPDTGFIHKTETRLQEEAKGISLYSTILTVSGGLVLLVLLLALSGM